MRQTEYFVLACLLGAASGCSSRDIDSAAGPLAPGKRDDSNPACQMALPGGLVPLSCVTPPAPTGGDIIDRAAAVRLGKALFWDVQVGSDGATACASCHFQAGSDIRTVNALNPGPNGVFESGGVTAPGQEYALGNISTDDRVGSSGVVRQKFVAVDPTSPADTCDPDPQAPFGTFRQVTPRKPPTVFGAIFNRVQFRDGRAESQFNGKDPFGDTANAAEPGALWDQASLASLALGPPTDPVEMACEGRPLAGPGSLATKLLPLQPLARQYVHPQDSAMAGLSAYPDRGLSCAGRPCAYAELVGAAFGEAAAASAEAKFGRFFGQAIAAYLATLIPDQTPLDRYLGGQTAALTANQVQGLTLFTGKANCVRCHAGAELSDATVSFAAAHGLLNANGGDQGFHNTGVRPTMEDLGRAGPGPRGTPFSKSGSLFDRGAFKTVQLRDVGLRAPYFHNGGKGSLGDVIDFYDRGGDFQNPEHDPMLVPLGLSDAEKGALVDFLQNVLTDCRVEKIRAPFDHPFIAPVGWGNIPDTGEEGLGPCP